MVMSHQQKVSTIALFCFLIRALRDGPIRAFFHLRDAADASRLQPLCCRSRRFDVWLLSYSTLKKNEETNLGGRSKPRQLLKKRWKRCRNACFDAIPYLVSEEPLTISEQKSGARTKNIQSSCRLYVWTTSAQRFFKPSDLHHIALFRNAVEGDLAIPRANSIFVVEIQCPRAFRLGNPDWASVGLSTFGASSSPETWTNYGKHQWKSHDLDENMVMKVHVFIRMRKTEVEVPGLSQNGTTHQPSWTSSLVPPLKLWHNNMMV